jgi:hypothetical protein
VFAVARGDIWVRIAPDESSLNVGVILTNEVVEVLAIYDNWAKIPWQIATGSIDAWVSAAWLEFPDGYPDWIVTPGP